MRVTDEHWPHQCSIATDSEPVRRRPPLILGAALGVNEDTQREQAEDAESYAFPQVGHFALASNRLLPQLAQFFILPCGRENK